MSTYNPNRRSRLRKLRNRAGKKIMNPYSAIYRRIDPLHGDPDASRRTLHLSTLNKRWLKLAKEKSAFMAANPGCIKGGKPEIVVPTREGSQLAHDLVARTIAAVKNS